MRTGGIRGAEVSDHGGFGFKAVADLRIEACYFTGSVVALQLGAVDDARVMNCTFDANVEIGILLNGGNFDLARTPTNWRILGCTFRNNNQDNNYHEIHPAVLFAEVGGSHYGVIAGCQFYDDQDPKTQRYAISFSGAATSDFITLADNRLSADLSAGASPFYGSPQEFDWTRILGCFLEHDEFGPGRGHALSLQE